MDPELFDRLMLDAIAEEIAARDFYGRVAQQVKDPNVAAMFEQFSREENEHGITLETFRFNPVARVEFSRVQDFLVAEQEPDVPFSFDMSPQDALRLAIKKEQKAAEFYRQLAEGTKDQELRRTYTELAEMERGHKVKLEELFVNAAYPEAW